MTQSHQVTLDAKTPVGTDLGMTPKELLLAGVCGCTAMDVVALLKKYDQALDSFDVRAEAEQNAEGQPKVFKSIQLKFLLTGQMNPEKVMEAVKLSQTVYCGVSAMLSRSVPIFYDVFLNGDKIGSGQAQFESD